MGSSESLRLFCALRLPDDVVDALVRWQTRVLRGRRAPAPGERLVPPANLHVTLAFLGGVVSYANEVKSSALGVPDEVLQTYGAVSAETAASMAKGARERLEADVAVAVTGIAGPGGGSPEKPVGLVYLNAAGPGGALAADFSVPGDRETVRTRAAVMALHLVRKLVTEL